MKTEKQGKISEICKIFEYLSQGITFALFGLLNVVFSFLFILLVLLFNKFLMFFVLLWLVSFPKTNYVLFLRTFFKAIFQWKSKDFEIFFSYSYIIYNIYLVKTNLRLIFLFLVFYAFSNFLVVCLETKVWLFLVLFGNIELPF